MSDHDHDKRKPRQDSAKPRRADSSAAKPRSAPPKPPSRAHSAPRPAHMVAAAGAPRPPHMVTAANAPLPPHIAAARQMQAARKAAQAQAGKPAVPAATAQPKPATPAAQAASQKLASTPAAQVPKASQGSFAAIQKVLGPGNRYSGFLAGQLKNGQLSPQAAARLAQVAREQQAKGLKGGAVVHALFDAQNKLDSAKLQSDTRGIYGKALLDSGKQLPGAALNFVKGVGNSLADTGKGLWGLGTGAVNVAGQGLKNAYNLTGGWLTNPRAAQATWNGLKTDAGTAVKGAQTLAKLGGGVLNDLRHRDDPKARARLEALKTGTIDSVKQGAGAVWNAATAGYQADAKKGNYAGALGRFVGDAGTMLFTGGLGTAAKTGSVAKVLNVVSKLPGGAAALSGATKLGQAAKLKGLAALAKGKGVVGTVSQATKARVAQGVFRGKATAQGTAKWAAEHANAGVKYGQASAGHALSPGHALAGMPGRWKGPAPKWTEFKPKHGLDDHIHQMRVKAPSGVTRRPERLIPEHERDAIRQGSATVPKYSTPYKALTPKQTKEMQSLIKQRKMTKEQYKRADWDHRFGKRRREGVEQYWASERYALESGQSGTRNWTPEQRQTILTGQRAPTHNNVPIQGHHRYNATDHPHIANLGENIHPATREEHLNRWHGGNWQNDTQGSPLSPNLPEDF